MSLAQASAAMTHPSVTTVWCQEVRDCARTEARASGRYLWSPLPTGVSRWMVELLAAWGGRSGEVKEEVGMEVLGSGEGA